VNDRLPWYIWYIDRKIDLSRKLFVTSISLSIHSFSPRNYIHGVRYTAEQGSSGCHDEKNTRPSLSHIIRMCPEAGSVSSRPASRNAPAA